MESKTCSMCNFEKHIKDFHKKYTDCKDCNCKRGLKRYYERKEKTSNHRKKHYEKKEDKFLQKQNDRYIHFKELLGNYVELANRLKALEEKADNILLSTE